MDDDRKSKRRLIAELGALRQVFDGAGDAITIVGLDGRILEVNRAAHQCLGYSHAEMLQMTLADIHPVDQAPMVAQRMAAVHERGSVLFETTHRRRDGTLVPVEFHARPVEFNGTPAVLCVVRDITLRQRPEEALLRTLIDNVPLAVYVKDTHSRFVLANQGIAEVMGVETPEGLLGKTDFDFFPHDMAAEFYAGEQELMQSGRPVVNHEEATLDAAGNPRWFLNTAVPWRDAGGSIVGLVGASLDITERKRAEEALRRQSAALVELQASVLDITAPHELPALLQTIVERAARLLNVPAGGLYLCDAERRDVCCVVSYNTLRDYQGTRLKYGEGAAGIVAQTGQPLIIDDYRTWSGRAGAYEHDRPFKALLSVPMTWQNRVIGVVHVMHNEEDRRFTREELELLSRFANHATIAVENARLHERAQADIAERKQAEETLRQQKEILQTVLDNAPIMTNFFEPDGALRWANRTWERIMGWSLAEGQAHDLFPEFYPAPEERQRVLDFIARADGNWEDFRVRRRDGTLIDTTWANVRLADGAIVGIGQDITKRRQAEAEKERLQAQLRQSQKMEAVGQLAAGVAHDFNNLLTTILGFAELLQLGIAPDDHRQAMLSHIRTAGQRAAVLVAQMLGFARKQMIAPRVVNLNDVVAGASATVRRALDATIDLTILPAPDLWRVKVDPEQFTSVVHDLALNARRAMPDGGRLTIETANVTLGAGEVRARPEIQPGDYVLLAVSDTGAGLSQEAAARVFEPFFFTSREVATGVGLRMAAVYGIVKQNHGYIYAESQEGAGTTVKVYLPRCEPREQPQDGPQGGEAVGRA